MGFTFGLGSDTMINQYQRDATLFKLTDMSSNIQKRNVALNNAASYVDYSFSHLTRFMLLDESNDSAATFLYEYQALLRSRIQQLITDLTAAMTRDIDRALLDTRTEWEYNSRIRRASQGYSGNVGEDAGAARVSYNYMTGYFQDATPAVKATNTAPDSIPYVGEPMWDTVPRVSPDTQADASFGGVGIPGILGGLRVYGTAALQQGFPEDGFTDALMDILNVSHQNTAVRYRETGGGFITHLNRYKFIDIEDSASSLGDPRFDPRNIRYANSSNSRNLNDDEWDAIGVPPEGPDFQSFGGVTSDFQRYARSAQAKNEFQRVLFEAIMEFDQKNYLRDMFRLSEQNGYFNDVQIASTSSLNSGSQAQHSLFLEYVPSNPSRPDLGGQIRIIFDRWTAFYHS